jgi:hypothetical protein
VPEARRKGQAPFDIWSWVHLASGVGLGLLAMPWWLALLALVGYEVLEGGLRRVKLEEGGLFEYESWGNIGADLVVGMLGYFGAAALLLAG